MGSKPPKPRLLTLECRSQVVGGACKCYLENSYSTGLQLLQVGSPIFCV